MSGNQLTRNRQPARKLIAAAVIGTLAAPVFAAPPAPEKLNNPPSVHWFAAWQENTFPAAPDFFATPSNVSGVPFMQTQLNGSAAANVPLGIKVETPLSTTDANSLFNSHYPMPSGGKAISYVFADMEQGTPAQQITNVTNLVKQVRASTWSKNAYVGQFDLTPLDFGQDSFRHGPQTYSKKNWDDSKVNMANTELYPGAPDFRNKSTFDWANGNIRTGLFIAPIGRMTLVQQKLPDVGKLNGPLLDVGVDKKKQIPWVARFNNWGNASLDSDQNPANGFAFVPGAPLPQAGLSASQTANQMMGRGDFSAQIAHYRMRGAYSVNAFEPGVVGYTKAQEEQDIRDGWYGASDPHVSHMNNIFAQGDAKAASLTLNPIVDGTPAAGTGNRSENSGTIWSGVYSLTLKQMDVLESNLDTINHLVKFGTVDAYDVFTVKNGSGYTYADPSQLAASRNSLIEAGMHRMLQFDLVTTRVYNSSTFTGSFQTKTVWLLNQNYLVFTNNNRNDVGIPEPTTFGILAAAGSLAVVSRRHRRSQSAE